MNEVHELTKQIDDLTKKRDELFAKDNESKLSKLRNLEWLALEECAFMEGVSGYGFPLYQLIVKIPVDLEGIVESHCIYLYGDADQNSNDYYGGNITIEGNSIFGDRNAFCISTSNLKLFCEFCKKYVKKIVLPFDLSDKIKVYETLLEIKSLCDSSYLTKEPTN